MKPNLDHPDADSVNNTMCVQRPTQQHLHCHKQPPLVVPDSIHVTGCYCMCLRCMQHHHTLETSSERHRFEQLCSRLWQHALPGKLHNTRTSNPITHKQHRTAVLCQLQAAAATNNTQRSTDNNRQSIYAGCTVATSSLSCAGARSISAALHLLSS